MHGVGDENEAVRMRIEGDLDGCRMKMDSVRNDAKVGTCQVFSFAKNTKDAGITVVKRPHSVEKMGDHGCTTAHGLGRLLIRGLGVANRIDDASRCNLRDEFHHLPALGGSGNHLDWDRFTLALRPQVLSAIASLNISE